MELICPKCQGLMRQYERNGVTVDQCADCRGLFLDRGELERLIDAERSWHNSQGRHEDARQYQDRRIDDRRFDDSRHHDERRYEHGYHPEHGQRKKRRSFLEDLFD
jgi:uncharacterized protein